MNKEEIIMLLKENATVVGKIEISQDKIKSVELDDFIKVNSPVYLNENTFFRQAGEFWLKYNYNSFYVEQPIVPVTPEEIDIEKRIEKMEKEQEEFFKEIKENIDLRFKLMEEKWKEKKSTKKSKDLILS